MTASALRTLGENSGAATLLVLLPGAGMVPDDVVDAGFFTAIRRRGVPLDLLVVELDLAALISSATPPALHAEILAPARTQGYRTIWLGGISLGGFCALSLAADAPGSIDGLCLLAPYPGSRLTARAIAAAGGLAHWRPSAAQRADPEFRVWHWLQAPPPDFPVFIGYGSEDRFAPRIGQIAGCFPPAASQIAPGGHTWPVWQGLWDAFLTHQMLGI